MAVAAGLALAGCASIQKNIEANTWSMTGAEPLTATVIDPPGTAPHTPTTRQELLASVAESYRKCELYKRSLLFGSRTSNFGFDLLTTTFSALGTAIKPIGTVHALTAAASISSGSKTALDADIYVNATAPLMAQALSTIYETKMDALKGQLEAAKDDAHPGVYFVDVLRVHNDCSLTEAMVSLQSQQAQRAAATVKAGDVTKGATFNLADGATVQVTALTADAKGVSVAYTLKPAGATAAPQPAAPLQTVLDMLNSKGAAVKTAS